MMNSLIKDYIQITFWAVGILGGITTAWVAIIQLKSITQQRQRELRFQQANAGKKLLEELFEDKEADQALDMLDFEYNLFKTDAGEPLAVSRQDVLEALDHAFDHENSKRVFILRSFDALFYRLSNIEHFINIGLTQEIDVIHPMDYYAKKMVENKSTYVCYIQQTTYYRALDFLNRFSTWKEK